MEMRKLRPSAGDIAMDGPGSASDIMVNGRRLPTAHGRRLEWKESLRIDASGITRDGERVAHFPEGAKWTVGRVEITPPSSPSPPQSGGGRGSSGEVVTSARRVSPKGPSRKNSRHSSNTEMPVAVGLPLSRNPSSELVKRKSGADLVNSDSFIL